MRPACLGVLCLTCTKREALPSTVCVCAHVVCRYGVLILVVEFIGLTSVLPYGLLLPFYTTSSGSKGLPIDDGRVVLPADKRFRVHILVPCYKVGPTGCCCHMFCCRNSYVSVSSLITNRAQASLKHCMVASAGMVMKVIQVILQSLLTHVVFTAGFLPPQESLEVITNTVTAALAAEVPPGVTRILYLCDDGKDPAKSEFIASLGDEARYVSGRTRKQGEINGKSANVNNCLRNIIFPEYEGSPEAIPMRELVVVFDADMAARRNFLLKVGCLLAPLGLALSWCIVFPAAPTCSASGLCAGQWFGWQSVCHACTTAGVAFIHLCAPDLTLCWSCVCMSYYAGAGGNVG